jgi:hypothetical protein
MEATLVVFGRLYGHGRKKFFLELSSIVSLLFKIKRMQKDKTHLKFYELDKQYSDQIIEEFKT